MREGPVRLRVRPAPGHGVLTGALADPAGGGPASDAGAVAWARLLGRGSLVQVAAFPESGTGCLGLLLLNQLALDHDLDLVADDEPAVQHHVEAEAEVLPVDLRAGAVGDPVAHHRVVELPVLLHLERNRMSGALDGQVTMERVAVRS